MSNEVFKTSKYLIYVTWETRRPGEGAVCGSLLLDAALTEAEAEEKRQMYEERAAAAPSYRRDSPATKSRYIYVDNRSEWWSRV